MRLIKSAFYLFFYILLVSFFLSIGADYSKHIYARMALALAVITLSLWGLGIREYAFAINKPAAIFFLAVLGFVILRMIWAGFCRFVLHLEGGSHFPFDYIVRSPLRWLFYVSVFLISCSAFKKRRDFQSLSWVLIGGSLFIAFNAMPAELMYKTFGYELANGEFRFFYPKFYFHPWVEKFIMSPLSHPNFVGDFIAVGFFPALGLSLYSLLELISPRSKNGTDDEPKQVLFSRFLMLLVLGLCQFAAILLLFSRGTILSVMISLTVFAVCFLIKYPKKKIVKWVSVFLLLGIPFLLWAGNLRHAWKEVQSLESEMAGTGSVQVNYEGIKRALSMFKASPIWGVGTGNYQNLSMQYASSGTNTTAYYLAQFQTMCHYVHLLAEEGMGGVLYLFFIFAYFYDVAKGLFRARSRYKFLMGLAFFCAALSVLIHASINDLMQRFSTSMLIYIIMGAGCTLLSERSGRISEDQPNAAEISQ